MQPSQKVSQSDLSDARSDLRRRGSKISITTATTDTRKIKANVYINDLKNLNRLGPKPTYQNNTADKTPTPSRQPSYAGKKLITEDEMYLTNHDQLPQQINKLKDMYNDHPYLPPQFKTTAQNFNQRMLDNIALDCRPQEKRFRFNKQDEFEAMMQAPISNLDKPRSPPDVYEDDLPSQILEIQQLTSELKEHPYRQTKLAQFNPKTRLISPFDRYRPSSSDSDKVRKNHHAPTRKISKSTFGDIVARFKDDEHEVEFEDEDDQSYSQDPSLVSNLEDLRQVTLMTKYLNKKSTDPQHSLQATISNNPIQPEFYRYPINQQLEYVMNGDPIYDISNHNVQLENTQGRNLMTALEVSPYARVVQENDLDPKQRVITQGVLRAFTNANSLKLALLSPKIDINFEELVTVLHYLANDNFFNQVLSGSAGDIDLFSSSSEGSVDEDTKKPLTSSIKKQTSKKKQSEEVLLPLSQLLAPKSRLSQYEEFGILKLYEPPPISIHEEQLKENAVKEEIQMRALFQGGKQYSQQKRRLSAEYKRLYIDREHQSTQVNFREIKQETKLELDDVLKEIEKWKQNRTKLKHLPMKNVAAVQMAVEYDLQYEAILFKYLRIILEMKPDSTKQQLLEQLKQVVTNLPKLRNKRNMVRRQSKLIYFFLLEYSKCVKTFRDQQIYLEKLREEEERRRLEEEKANNKSINQILFEMARDKQRQDPNFVPKSPPPKVIKQPVTPKPKPQSIRDGDYTRHTSISALKVRQKPGTVSNPRNFKI